MTDATSEVGPLALLDTRPANNTLIFAKIEGPNGKVSAELYVQMGNGRRHGDSSCATVFFAGLIALIGDGAHGDPR